MDELDPSQRIRTKAICILITNACNLSCGGCNQLVGQLPKKKIFHLPIAEIRAAIKKAIVAAKEDWPKPWFPPTHRAISIYGGEPTVHPKWPEILRMLYNEFPDWPFLILTNGRTFEGVPLPNTGDPRFDFYKTRKDISAHDKNIFWRIDLKNTDKHFVPTLIAPIDVIKDPDPGVYYEMAQKYCYIYEKCETIIYKNKGYFCINAGAMDWLYHDGANGWDLDRPGHPFKRTNEEVEAQGRLFCHRCYFSIYKNPVIDIVEDMMDIPMQTILSKSLVSETNNHKIKKSSGDLITFDTKEHVDFKILEKEMEEINQDFEQKNSRFKNPSDAQ